MGFFSIINNGPEVVDTDYFESENAAEGIIHCSLNAGVIRVLLPPVLHPAIPDMQTAVECVLSQGPWPEMGQSLAYEIMFDDDSVAPYAMHLGVTSFDWLPARPKPGRNWALAVWIKDETGLHKVLERDCHWRTVPIIPWMKARRGKA